MNPLLHYLVGGQVWFACGLFFVAVVALDALQVFDDRPRARRVVHFFMVLSIPMAALTGTPMPLWLAVPLVVCVCAHTALAFTNHRLFFRRISATISCGVVLLALAMELPWYIGPGAPSGRVPGQVYILGDSLSAGGFGESRSWPTIVAGSVQAEVRDLSRDGATVRTALEENRDVLSAAPPEESLIFIELGGNDMVGGTPSSEFENALASLLAVCRGDIARPRKVVMMELPVMFGRWRLGAIQRRLARRYGVVMVPKRVLAGIILSSGNAGPDSLHLSQQGQDRFAEAALPWLGLPR